ncbi:MULTISPECIES: rod shape-determining protein MreC [unclassified Gilliamella]|uniref:rod shape-determining protein MreC n=1 Tax=unclassified Gilliamella TaxID=2685620 RepID=UPI001C6A5F22|nr:MULTISPECIES: rod shape-determining protein MreC [unclassified Gilliamella]MCX8600539.1 rod shape-determining protein MreC [Gilliamella sp. B3722]MCX8608749.1 rod shape-determining protein MreC [Gilliamella sp. B3771]MCX8609755.1 rod shape-determining protein MreC [Gilliamella sp. B3891]MCX8612155.1 rod shape-determining protein MreC [Gilliamella sp. B3773]MCX8616549.1 rod shape-determining protein MreC [Gilliamella sp. B3770]
MKLLFSKRSPLSVQLFISLALALTLIVVDSNYRPFKQIRYYLDTLISPLYYISNAPKSSFDLLYEMSKTRDTLVNENEKLHQTLMQQKSELLLLEHLKHENDRLRGLLDSPLRHDEHKMAAQVLLTDTDPYVYQVVINKGKDNGVYVGQPVVDEKGIVGQIYETAQNTSRAILVCDYQHAIPVQVLRNDISMVAVGNGCSNDLTLDFLPNNVDIKVGDVLVTSGLDGRFPEGYPVAVVSSVKLDISDSTPIISATPTADIKRLRYLLLLWGDQGATHEGS